MEEMILPGIADNRKQQLVSLEWISKLKTPETSCIVITHYQRLLDYIKPDIVHVLYKGRIVKTAGPELALELEKRGYDWIKAELGE